MSLSEQERPHHQERFFEALVQNNPVAIVTLDLNHLVVACNPAFERLFGYQADEVIGQELDPLISSSETYPEASDYTRRVMRGETIHATGKRNKKDGSLTHVEIQGVPVVVDGEQVGVLTLYHDISEQIAAEQKLRDFYSSFVTIMDSIDADVYVADLETYEILFMNQHMRASFGRELVGETCWEVFRGAAAPCPHCTNYRLLDEVGEPAGEIVWEGQNPITGRWYKNSDRAIRWDDGRFVRLQIATDISRLKEAEYRLKHMATHDALTELPNRAYFLERLTVAIKNARHTKAFLGVMFVDLDEFKSVNDRYGHEQGDMLLKMVGKRLKNCLRQSDVIARIAGDEFTIVLENLSCADDAARVADKIIREIGCPFTILGLTVMVSVSVGISLYPANGDNPDILLSRADEAMYQVKKTGKNNFGFYSSGLSTDTSLAFNRGQ